MAPKLTVYVLQSMSNPMRPYVGLTSDLATRLETHNSGGSTHTASGVPWRVVVAVKFAEEKSAVAFEQYLKTGSGRAFMRRHFWPALP